MATKKQASERLIDLILDLVIEKEGLDLKPISKRIIDPSTGQTKVVSEAEVNENTKSVVYSADYRQTAFSPTLIGVVDNVVSLCLVNDDESGGYLHLSDTSNLNFNLGMTEQDGNGDGDITYGYDSWISFVSTDAWGGGAGFEGSGANVGSLSCSSAPGTLRLTTEVLEALTQFVSFNREQTSIDTTLAQEVLDTNIYELLPGQITKQQRIAKLFNDFEDLIGPKPTDADYGFDFDGNEDGVGDTWDDLIYSQNYWHEVYGIKPDIDQNIGNIIRLEDDAIAHGVPGQSLESMRNIIDDYLRDLDYVYQTEFDDDRQEQMISEQGYLQIRHMNQSIIVRNEEDKDLGIVGENVISPNWLTKGFTIAMWVRFLTKTKGGTLFNFGNPIRSINPYGFRLETFTVDRSQYDMSENINLPTDAFLNDNYERFLRLVVYEPETGIRDSHFGTEYNVRIDTTDNLLGLAYEYNKNMAFNYTRIPIDFKEWYYVVATYNPIIDETNSFNQQLEEVEYNYSPLYWQNHINHYNNTSTANSGYGAKCKVEFISKKDLMRAQGFKT